METNSPLEDAEALRMLLDNVTLLDQHARQLADLAGRLTHTARHFAVRVVDDQPVDPRHLLAELGAALEIGSTMEGTLGALAEALGSLSFAWTPSPARSVEIQERALAALRERLAARSEARWRRRPRGTLG